MMSKNGIKTDKKLGQVKYFTYEEYLLSFNSNWEYIMTKEEYEKNPIPYPKDKQCK